jgi:SAM-dependent methyltransferase
MIKKQFSAILAIISLLFCEVSHGVEESKVIESLELVGFDFIGNLSDSTQHSHFREYLSEHFGDTMAPLIKIAPDMENYKKYQIFEQDPGYAFHTITPAHLIALMVGCVGNLKVFDAGCGDGFWSILIASQGNNVEAIDIYSNSVSYLKVLELHGLSNYASRINFQQGDFIPNIKLLSHGGETFDMFLSFNSLHFLTPQRVDEFARQSYVALKKGGTVIGVTNSPYQYNPESKEIIDFHGTDKAITEVTARYVEHLQQTFEDLYFPGYVQYSMPTLFRENGTAKVELMSMAAAGFQFKINYPQAEQYPNVSYPSTKINFDETKNGEYFDIDATVVIHLFFKKSIEEAFKRAGFTTVFVFYIDNDTNKVFQDFDISQYTPFTQELLKQTKVYQEYKESLYKKNLSVGFCAVK